MEIQRAPNAAGSKITVTTTAANIFDLINIAAGLPTPLENAGYPSRVNAISIEPENGDIRILFDGNIPTTDNGFLVRNNSSGYFPNVPLKKMQIVSTGGSVICSVMIGLSTQGENIVISAASGNSTSGTTVASYINGSKTVASAGTAEALGSTAAFRVLTVQANEANTGNVYLGGSGVDSTNGITLPATYSYTYNLPGDIADIYIDVDTNGEGVKFLYIT